MGDANFEATAVWRQTLGERQRNDPHKQPRTRLRLSYFSLRSRIAILLDELPRTVPYFTDHSISHVDALWETASMVCGGAITLNPAEGYVLGCAFAFHDAAMGLIPATEDMPGFIGQHAWLDLMSSMFFKVHGRWPTDAEVDDPPDDVHESCLVEAIRQTHAERGAALVAKPFHAESSDDVSYLIDDSDLRQAFGPLIGDLAESHWWDVDELPEKFRNNRPIGSLPELPTDWTIDPLKVACVLRIADATQLDNRRAQGLRFILRAPQRPSWDHWRFQETLSRPQLADDHVLYSSMRPFKKKEAAAWWLALDYLRSVDRELRLVDSLLHDMKKTRLAARGVACINQPERFAEVFPVDGWRPVDVDVTISDTPNLIGALGGKQLYGPAPAVAVRELIQNAQDAVLARRAIHPSFRNGEVIVSLQDRGENWVLEVCDNGVGMDEDIIRDGLLDFGQSGWRTSAVRSAFIGLASGGFRPTGTFGIGFYSAFMLGNEITLTTRRFDLGRHDARELLFDEGLTTRPLLCPLPHDSHFDPGTTVEVRLRTNPLAPDGLLGNAGATNLTDLIRQLVPSHKVPITVHEGHDDTSRVLPAFDLESADPDEVFDRLYPETPAFGTSQAQRTDLSQEFRGQATEVLDEDGRRLGLAALGHHLPTRPPEMHGVVLVDGFRADDYSDFVGYLGGKASRASRDKVQLACTPAQLRTWFESQLNRLHERGKLDPPTQLSLAEILHQAIGSLPDDHHIALTADGPLRIRDIQPWAEQRDHVFISYGGGMEWDVKRLALSRRKNGELVTLPENWIVRCPSSSFPFDDLMFQRSGDPVYARHQHDQGTTWQKTWWRMSGGIGGLLIEQLCQAWSCQPGDLLAPIAERNWNDHAQLDLPTTTAELPGLHVHRP